MAVSFIGWQPFHLNILLHIDDINTDFSTVTVVNVDVIINLIDVMGVK